MGSGKVGVISAELGSGKVGVIYTNCIGAAGVIAFGLWGMSSSTSHRSNIFILIHKICRYVMFDVMGRVRCYQCMNITKDVTSNLYFMPEQII
jgi:hypothetical protein